jgi:hypothetical protein
MNTNKSVVKSANMEDKNITAFYAWKEFALMVNERVVVYRGGD